MPVNFSTVDTQLGNKDLDEEYFTESWLIDQHVGNVLFSWGVNNNGQLGFNDTTNRSSPVQIGSLVNWKQVSSQSGVKIDGTLWVWGTNSSGQLGIGNTVRYSSPVQVGALTNWQKISCGYSQGSAIKTDGTLWSWGANFNGELGLGDRTDRNSPVQVGTLTNWRDVSFGKSYCLATKFDGTLWAWGANSLGSLGLNDITDRSSPTIVGSLTNWKQISAGGYDNSSLAITTSGNLYAWGNNQYGQLGIGNTVRYSSPIQVGSLTNWKQVSIGGIHTVAIKTDGTLWSWGRNDKGQLGLGVGTGVLYSSPVQVGSLSNWKQVVCGYNSTLCIKTDGTLWAWGSNSSGQLGVGGTVGFGIGYSSPVQVGSLNNWKQITVRSGIISGQESVLAITYREI